MEKVLREILDLDKIKQLENSEAQNPGEILGAHMEKVGCLITAYLPDAKTVSVKWDKKKYLMERVDSEGFFAVILVDELRLHPYKFYVEYNNGETEEVEDPYSYRFKSRFTDEDLRKLGAGTFYNSYEKLGAHPVSMDGVKGVNFAVWAPGAMRVSVVGDFNYWNGRRHQMKKLGDSGVYELFIPGLKAGEKYKFEVKTPKAEPMLKADPYAFQAELRPATASVVCGLGNYKWNDKNWVSSRGKGNLKEKPLSIYEVHLGSWMQKPIEKDADGNDVNGSQFYNYRELAEKLAAYAKEMEYTHVELLPVMEHPLDASWGYQVTGYYAPTSRFGTPEDFKVFVDHLHEEGIGVILDWAAAEFPKDAHGLAAFDGTCLYEHVDPRQGENTKQGTLLYNYGRPQVSNFLISNALYWAKEFHVDGIRMNAVASMLYLDFGKNAGEWVANIYGGHENLDAVEFLKHLNSMIHRETKGVMTIAEESTAWPRITGDLKEEGLGFDYEWNLGWMNDFLRYMKNEPQFRHQNYGDLTFSMLYAYSEDFVQIFSHDEVVHGKGSMVNKMPGDTQEKKLGNLRAAYGFFMGHPGKKLLFMGQDFAQVTEWNEETGLDWGLLETPDHARMKEYVKALNHLYRTQPALYEKDYELEGFEWISCTYDKENIVIFIRRSKKKEETLLFACNFGGEHYEKFQVGVPFAGKYKEILNSDGKQFGGAGQTNPRMKQSRAEEKDNRGNSITINLAPMTVAVFSCTPEEAARTVQEKKKEEQKAKMEKQEYGLSPAKAAKAASEALAKRGTGALDKLSERVGQIMKKTK